MMITHKSNASGTSIFLNVLGVSTHQKCYIQVAELDAILSLVLHMCLPIYFIITLIW